MFRWGREGSRHLRNELFKHEQFFTAVISRVENSTDSRIGRKNLQKKKYITIKKIFYCKDEKTAPGLSQKAKHLWDENQN